MIDRVLKRYEELERNLPGMMIIGSAYIAGWLECLRLVTGKTIEELASGSETKPSVLETRSCCCGLSTSTQSKHRESS